MEFKVNLKVKFNRKVIKLFKVYLWFKLLYRNKKKVLIFQNFLISLRNKKFDFFLLNYNTIFIYVEKIVSYD